MKNYTITIRRHYEFNLEAESREEALRKLNDTISDEGFDDNRVIFEDADIVEPSEGGEG